MLSSPTSSVATRYTKAICHLNHARRTRRLGLILGAGVSRELQIPDWKELIDRIQAQLNYAPRNDPETYRAEQLFQHYRKRRTQELGWDNGQKLDSAIVAGCSEKPLLQVRRQRLQIR